MNDAIELDRLSKRFRSTQALKDVTLNVPEGSVFSNRSDLGMDPYFDAGWFIDLDFVEQDEE